MSCIVREGRPFEDMRWELAEKFGWTLEYIDALKLGDLHELIQVQDGRAKGNGSLMRRR
jgi:hypothetical protein